MAYDKNDDGRRPAHRRDNKRAARKKGVDFSVPIKDIEVLTVWRDAIKRWRDSPALYERGSDTEEQAGPEVGDENEAQSSSDNAESVKKPKTRRKSGRGSKLMTVSKALEDLKATLETTSGCHADAQAANRVGRSQKMIHTVTLRKSLSGQRTHEVHRAPQDTIEHVYRPVSSFERTFPAGCDGSVVEKHGGAGISWKQSAWEGQGIALGEVNGNQAEEHAAEQCVNIVKRGKYLRDMECFCILTDSQHVLTDLEILLGERQPTKIAKISTTSKAILRKLIALFDDYPELNEIVLQWVKGHWLCEHNHVADELARHAAYLSHNVPPFTSIASPSDPFTAQRLAKIAQSACNKQKSLNDGRQQLMAEYSARAMRPTSTASVEDEVGSHPHDTPKDTQARTAAERLEQAAEDDDLEPSLDVSKLKPSRLHSSTHRSSAASAPPPQAVAGPMPHALTGELTSALLTRPNAMINVGLGVPGLTARGNAASAAHFFKESKHRTSLDAKLGKKRGWEEYGDDTTTGAADPRKRLRYEERSRSGYTDPDAPSDYRVGRSTRIGDLY